MESKRQQIERKLEALKRERSTWVPRWRELSSYIQPYSSRFFTTDRNRGNERNYWIYNEAATNALDALSAGMMSGMTSPARPWFRLATMDPALNEMKPVKVWLDLAQQRMADVFLRSNLYTVLPQVYSDEGNYGTAAFLVEKDDETVIRCQMMPIGSYCLANSHRGTVDTCYREFMMTRRQLVQEFGLENCSAQVQAAYKNNQDLEVWVEVVQAIEPNADYDARKPLAKYKKFSSCYIERGSQEDKTLRESGYDTFPVMAPRWSLTGEDVYGTSPAMKVLGVIKALQIREKRLDQAIEKLGNPALNIPVSLKNSPVSSLPGGANYVDMMGGQTIAPTYQLNPAMLEPLQASITKAEQRINTAFYKDLFLMIASDDRSGLTATEIMERKEEKMLMLGPVLERQNDELLDPLIDRTFGLMLELNVLPPPPPQLHGQQLNVEYISILAQARKLQNVTAIQQTAQYVQSLAPQFPEIIDKFDPDASVAAFADAVGVPPILIRDDQETAAIRAQRAQQQQAQQAMQTAEQGAQIVQKLGATPVTPDTALGQMAARLGAPQ